jgi:hypothetical protein
MRRTTALAVVAVVVAALTACHTITEDLPSRPSPVQVGGPGSIPIIVVPIPVQTPAPIPPAVPSPSSPAAPSPRPTATPPPDSGEPPTTNTSPVARLGASVYFVECGGVPVPGTSRARTAPVGCRVHLDCTPKDSSNAPTIPRGTPRWTYSNTGIIDIGGNSPFNPVITGKAIGCVDMFAEVDGVRSDTFGICFE